jgi:hypothetical protein
MADIVSGPGRTDMVCELLTGVTRKSRLGQLSYGRLDCLALLPFSIEDFNLEVWEMSL